jgi:hypothetical protein
MSEPSDHHAHLRGLRVRTASEIRDHINADHPCCIGVGEAVVLLDALEQAERERDNLLEHGRVLADHHVSGCVDIECGYRLGRAEEINARSRELGWLEPEP